MPKRSLILAVFLAVAVLAPAGNAHAATLFGGADMNAEPGALFPPPPPSAYVNVENPPGATNNFATVSGVLTSVRLRTKGNAGVGVIRVVRLTGMPNPSTFTFLNVGPEIPMTVTADASVEGHITEVLTRHPIEIGDRLSWFTSQAGVQAHHNYQGESATGQCAYLDDGATHLVGTSFDYTDVACNQNVQLLQGSIEPDADGDGYGDETQDLCPTNAATEGPCPDTDPPQTTITKRAPARTKRDTVKFRFRSDEPGSTFACKIDKKAFKPCVSPRRVRNLDDGKHRFKVRATDAAGNRDPKPATDRFKVATRRRR